MSEGTLFQTGAATHVGRVREANEDSFLAAPGKGLWAVADGMGGHEDGALASRLVVEALDAIEPAATANELLTRCEEQIAAVNARLVRRGRERHALSGATLVALLVYDAHYACLWSGDSRLYRVRDGSIAQITRDHTEAADLVAGGVLTDAEARVWPRRNVVTRAIGVAEPPELDFVHETLVPGDTFVLCSDGLTAHVEDAEILAATAQPHPQIACDDLIALTLQRGARDNVTLIVVQTRPPDVHRPWPGAAPMPKG